MYIIYTYIYVCVFSQTYMQFYIVVFADTPTSQLSLQRRVIHAACKVHIVFVEASSDVDMVNRRFYLQNQKNTCSECCNEFSFLN